MLFKSLAALASLSLISLASAWEIFMYETTAGGDPEDCNGGGTTVSGTGSVCQLAAPNTVAMQVIDDPEGCECKSDPRYHVAYIVDDGPCVTVEVFTGT